MKIGFIGLGLIGGSIARAVRHFYPDAEILACSRTRASVEQAVHDGVVSWLMDHVTEDFGDCDYIFLCAPGSSGHPMAGSEKTGYANSKRILIENAYYVITPAARVPQDAVERYRTFVESLKALPLVLDFRTHDYVTAGVSLSTGCLRLPGITGTAFR